MTPWLKAYLAVHLALAQMIYPLLPHSNMLGGSGAPPVWVGGYITPVYDSSDGTLQDNQFSSTTGGFVGIIASTTVMSSTTAQQVFYPSRTKVGPTALSFMGFKMVHHISDAAYLVFDVSGVRMKVPTTIEYFNSLTGTVSVLPTYNAASATPE